MNESDGNLFTRVKTPVEKNYPDDSAKKEDQKHYIHSTENKEELQKPNTRFCISKAKSLFKKHFQEYCSNTTIHGLKYIYGESGRHFVERSFWLVLFLLSISGSAYMIQKVWQKWQDSPVIVSFSESWTPVWQIPFPSVTICSEAKSKNRIFNITEAIYKNITDPKKQNILDAISLVCDNHVNRNSPNKFIDENGTKHITRISPNIDDVLFLCRWKLGMPVNCTELFVPVMTEEGQCFSFNILHTSDSYRENAVQFRDSIKLQMYPKSWTLGEGYDKKAPLDVFPMRALGAGAKSGLFVVLRTFSWDLDYYCRGPVQGYKIKLHNPAEIPQIGESYF